MTEVLDQSEVDALLSAVSSADGDRSETTMAPTAKPNAEISLYDFKRPERVSREQMRALQTIHEGFARNVGALLSALLRTIVDTRVATTEQLAYSEFIQSLPSPTSFTILLASQLGGQLCLEMSPTIVFPIVDRMLGGASWESPIPSRPLTTIEVRLVNRIIERMLASLSEAWSDLTQVKFEVDGSESNPHLVQIVAPNEVVVVIGFEIRMGARAGTMSLCIPFNVIEPVIGKLTTQNWLTSARKSTDGGHHKKVTQNLRRARVPLRAFLGEAHITIGDLLSLAVGDVLKLDKLCTKDFMLQVRERNKFAGRLGRLRGHRAIQITRGARPDEPL